MLSWPVAKDPNEVLDYQFDWGQMRLDQDEQITTATVTTDSSLQISGIDDNGKIVTFWAAGGTAGEVCDVLCRITTDKGRTYDQTSRLRIRDR